ncbi:tryptophan-rich sensory protein [Streptomyces erythrochromogenes]|uniref:tryptophan-rich sensory protein n=1 Tax=Streptomyces erythrochromogenes TaxID=285574 RepID=UPI0037F7B17B
MFFAARSPRGGLVGTALLTLSTLDVLRVTARVDRTAAAALTPYAAWCACATTLNADIVRRNGGCR